MSLVECPSGLAIEIRKLRVKEANMLADQSAARRSNVLDTVLSSLTASVVSPGPYSLRGDGSLDWSKVLVGDRFVALLESRIATYGEDYVFDTQCQARGCRERFTFPVNLRSLPVQKFTDESLAKFSSGNLFSGVIPSNQRNFYFRLQTGEMEAKASKLAKGKLGEAMTMALAVRIHEVQGVAGNDRLRFFEQLEMDDVTDMIAQMDSVDGGVDTTIHVECPYCQDCPEVTLPFGRAFWLPSKKQSTQSAMDD